MKTIRANHCRDERFGLEAAWRSRNSSRQQAADVGSVTRVRDSNQIISRQTERTNEQAEECRWESSKEQHLSRSLPSLPLLGPLERDQMIKGDQVLLRGRAPEPRRRTEEELQMKRTLTEDEERATGGGNSKKGLITIWITLHITVKPLQQARKSCLIMKPRRDGGLVFSIPLAQNAFFWRVQG